MYNIWKLWFLRIVIFNKKCYIRKVNYFTWYFIRIYKKIEQNVNNKLKGIFYNTSAYIQQRPSIPPSLPVLLPVQVALSKAESYFLNWMLIWISIDYIWLLSSQINALYFLPSFSPLRLELRLSHNLVNA